MKKDYFRKNFLEYRTNIVYIIIFFFIAFGFIAVYRLSDKNSDKINVSIEDLENAADTDMEVTASINKKQEWVGEKRDYGAEFHAACVNNTGKDINWWKVKLIIPEGAYIDSIWNGSYEIEEKENEQVLIFTPNHDTTIIFAGEERTFGFVLYTQESYKFTSLDFSGSYSFSVKQNIWYWILVILTFVVLLGIMIRTFLFYRIRYYVRQQEHDKQLIVQSMNTFVNFIDAKDPYTKGHSARVAHYSSEIAKRMGKTTAEVDTLYYIALMHDVGKIGIPDGVLNKPGKLTDQEREVIQTHTTLAESMLKDFTALPDIVAGAKYHHERFDGKGYPNHLSGKDIPECARIICIADSYDAMSSDRCYRKQLSAEVILDELRACSGNQFDPDIVKYMIDILIERENEKLEANEAQ